MTRVYASASDAAAEPRRFAWDERILIDVGCPRARETLSIPSLLDGLMAQKNEATSWVLLVLPVMVVWALFQSVPYLMRVREVDDRWFTIGLIAAAIVGVGLFRRARTVRDHEWHRARSVKKLGRTYAAEDRGAWSGSDPGVLELGPLGRAAMQRMEQGQVGTILRSNDEGYEIGERSSDVHLLIEEAHVSRIGTVSADGEHAVEGEGTIGAANRSPMDKAIDRLGGLTEGMRNRMAERRQAKVDRMAARIASQPAVAATPAGAGVGGGFTGFAQPSSSLGSAAAVAPASTPAGQHTCPACRTPNPAMARFCQSCGTPMG